MVFSVPGGGVCPSWEQYSIACTTMISRANGEYAFLCLRGEEKAIESMPVFKVTGFRGILCSDKIHVLRYALSKDANIHYIMACLMRAEQVDVFQN